MKSMIAGPRNRADESRHSATAMVLFLISLVWISSAPAQVEPAAEPEEEVVVDDGFEIHESNFNQWVFGAQNASQGLSHIESRLALEVEAVHRVCGLTEEQKAKLQLAGHGDVKRFFDAVAVLHAKFMKVRRNRNAFNGLWQDIQPLRVKFSGGLFREGSFFRKVLSRSLNAEQSSKYEEAESERRRFHYHAKLAFAVTMMERAMPLRAEQRERFIQVLEKETNPPKAFGQHDYYVVLYQLSKVPEQKLQPIFDEAQWKVLKQFSAQGQTMGARLQ